jgi:hypothetical protein
VELKDPSVTTGRVRHVGIVEYYSLDSKKGLRQTANLGVNVAAGCNKSQSENLESCKSWGFLAGQD